MMTLTKPALIAAIMLTSAPAFAEINFEAIDVDVDLTAIQNANAAAYWTSVGDDLEAALVSRLTSRLAEDGAKISIDIDELSLANTFQSALGAGESELAGSVLVSDGSNTSARQFYNLTVSFEPASLDAIMDEETIVKSRPSSEYYADMIDAFADRVVENLN